MRPIKYKFFGLAWLINTIILTGTYNKLSSSLFNSAV